MTATRSNPRTPRLLITSGPTYEPIDAVRFIGNRSSGRLGAALADAADSRDWPVTALIGCQSQKPARSGVRVRPFRTTADLGALLIEEIPGTDILIMAAAVADFRPRLAPGQLESKIRRSAAGLALELEPTPDLLASCAPLRRPNHLFVGFALEPKAELIASAQSKLARKKIDLVVANPLETMDAPTIEAFLVGHPDSLFAPPVATPAPMTKPDFAEWLLDHLQTMHASIVAESTHAR